MSDIEAEWERYLARLERKRSVLYHVGLVFTVGFVVAVMVLSQVARIAYWRWQLGVVP